MNNTDHILTLCECRSILYIPNFNLAFELLNLVKKRARLKLWKLDEKSVKNGWNPRRRRVHCTRRRVGAREKSKNYYKNTCVFVTSSR